MNYFASFDSNQLTSVPGLTILATNPYVPPKRKLTIGELARTSRSKVGSDFYDSRRRIAIRIGIGRATRALVEQSLDTLMGLLQGVERDLVLSQSGGVRRYTCTLADTPIIRAGGSYIEMDLIFECSDAYGYDTAYTVIANVTGVTTATRTDAYTFSGSAPWQTPVIQVKVTALTGGTSKAISVGNLATSQEITVTRTWSANDLLIIDSNANTVTVNGSEVEFEGAFPEFQPGAGTLSYADTFTTRTFNLYAYYYRRYL